ncbi:MAG: 16S rRNA (cytosine(1402)-N(4))-methyltransferase, partial [Acidimicrobiales bacterium]
MRSPSTGEMEELLSARFQNCRPEKSSNGAEPVEGLRMNQDFEHRPVMVAEVVDLLGPVPPGLLVDLTLGGAGHATA